MFIKTPEEFHKADELQHKIRDVLNGEQTNVCLQALATASAMIIHDTVIKEYRSIAAFKIAEAIVHILSLLPDEPETKDEKTDPS